MSSYVIVVHIIDIFLLFGVLTVMNISEMHAKISSKLLQRHIPEVVQLVDWSADIT